MLHSVSYRWCSVLVFGFSLWGCALEYGSADDDAVPEVGVVSEALAGRGDSFWQPLRRALVTNVYYCYDGPVSSALKSLTLSALKNSWGKAANIDFFDEGQCSSAAHAAEAIHILPWPLAQGLTPYMGTRSRGLGMMLPFDYQGNPCDTQWPFVDYNECMRIFVVHEFGHALGFEHESARPDVPQNAVCPQNHRAVPQPAPSNIDTLITNDDAQSIMDVGYCGYWDSSGLSEGDILGVRAIYGSYSSDCSSRACWWARYDKAANPAPQYAIRAQRPTPAPGYKPSSGDAVPGKANALYLQTTDTRGVGVQSFIDTWERLKLVYVSGGPNDTFIRYGDTVAVQDRWGRYLSGQNNDPLKTEPWIGDWERWVVRGPAQTILPDNRVLVNGPVRLYNAYWQKWLCITGTNNDVRLLAGDGNTGACEWRINGPLKQL